MERFKWIFKSKIMATLEEKYLEYLQTEGAPSKIPYIECVSELTERTGLSFLSLISKPPPETSKPLLFIITLPSEPPNTPEVASIVPLKKPLVALISPSKLPSVARIVPSS